MPRYRFDFLRGDGTVLAAHEIDYGDDKAAIAAGHEINGFPPIGRCFRVWRDGQLIHQHDNGEHAVGDAATEAPTADPTPSANTAATRGLRPSVTGWRRLRSRPQPLH